MALASLVGAIGSIAGGFIGNKSAKRAAQAQEQAAAAAAQRTREGQQQATQYLEPVYDQGMDARRYQLGALGLPGGVGREEFDRAFQESPGYQFQMDQGVQALDRSAAARGMLNSGAQMKVPEPLWARRGQSGVRELLQPPCTDWRAGCERGGWACQRGDRHCGQSCQPGARRG
jgi:hypothetical protein